MLKIFKCLSYKKNDIYKILYLFEEFSLKKNLIYLFN